MQESVEEFLVLFLVIAAALHGAKIEECGRLHEYVPVA